MKTEQQRKQYTQELNAGLSTITARRRELAAAAHDVLGESIKAAEKELQDSGDVEEYGPATLNDHYIESMGENIDDLMRPVKKHYNMNEIEVDIAVHDAVEIAYKLYLTPHTQCMGNA